MGERPALALAPWAAAAAALIAFVLALLSPADQTVSDPAMSLLASQALLELQLASAGVYQLGRELAFDDPDLVLSDFYEPEDGWCWSRGSACAIILELGAFDRAGSRPRCHARSWRGRRNGQNGLSQRSLTVPSVSGWTSTRVRRPAHPSVYSGPSIRASARRTSCSSATNPRWHTSAATPASHACPSRSTPPTRAPVRTSRGGAPYRSRWRAQERNSVRWFLCGQSLAGQDYPHVEHLVVDGGSTDETLDFLRSCGDRVRWISEPDCGQSDALNKGFRRVRGQVLTWLNADDVMAPGAAGHAVDAFLGHPGVGLVYGQGQILDDAGTLVGPFAEIEQPWLWRLLHLLDYILQPAAFFRAGAVGDGQVVDPGLRWSMDWDLWIRLAARSDLLFLRDRVLGCSREHEATKTATGGLGRIRELGRLVRRHTGRFWSPGVRLYALDTLARQLQHRLPGTVARRVARAIAGISRRIATDLPAYADGWLGPRGASTRPVTLLDRALRCRPPHALRRARRALTRSAIEDIPPAR